MTTTPPEYPGGSNQPDPSQSAPPPMPAPYTYSAQVGPGAVPVDNNLGWALGGIFVCWPFGIPALIKSLQVNNLWMVGRHQEAELAAAEAKKWGKIGIIVGASLLGLYVLIMIAYFVFLFGMIGFGASHS